jgi:hypothetical protein
MHYAATIMHYSQQKIKLQGRVSLFVLSKLFHKPLQRSFMPIKGALHGEEKRRRVLTKEISTQIVEIKSNKTISSSKTKRKKVFITCCSSNTKPTSSHSR